MDCTICFEPIDERTGSATLSCGHIYHFGCLARWILKTQTCPYCRHQTNAFETIGQDEESDAEGDSEDESTEISDAEDEHERSFQWIRIGPGHWRTFPRLIREIPEFNEEEHALWNFRSFFQGLDETGSPPQTSPEKVDQYIPYSDIFRRVEYKKNGVRLNRGYESN